MVHSVSWSLVIFQWDGWLGDTWPYRLLIKQLSQRALSFSPPAELFDWAHSSGGQFDARREGRAEKQKGPGWSGNTSNITTRAEKYNHRRLQENDRKLEISLPCLEQEPSILDSVSVLHRRDLRHCLGSTMNTRPSRCSKASGESGSTSAPRRQLPAPASSCTSPSSMARSSNSTSPKWVWREGVWDGQVGSSSEEDQY